MAPNIGVDLSIIIQFALAILLLWIGTLYKSERNDRRDERKEMMNTLKEIQQWAQQAEDRLKIVEYQCNKQHGTFTLGKGNGSPGG